MMMMMMCRRLLNQFVKRQSPS